MSFDPKIKTHFLKDGKECLLELLKGIYTYKIELSNTGVYKKGEYKFDEEIIITLKEE